MSITQAIMPLDPNSIDILSDVALRLQKKYPDAIEDALALMKIALIQKPDESFIKNKVEQWSALLNSSEMSD